MPLETVDFKTPDELIAERSMYKGAQGTPLTPDIFTTMPLDTQMAFDPPQPYYQPLEHAAVRKAPEEAHGFFGTLGHSFSENNEVFELGRSISSTLEHVNALSDPVPEGWTPFREDALDGIDQKYWGYVTDAVSPKEQEARIQYIKERQLENESYNNGSYLAKFIGGGAGILMGPSSLMFPISSTIKYAKASQNIIKNMLTVGTEVSLQSVAHNAWMEGLKVGGNLEDFAVNSIVDATAGMGLVGAAAGFGSIVSGGKLFNARRAMNLSREGIEVKFNVDEAGAINKENPYLASAIPGTALSAMEVSTAQDFLNSTVAKEGLFKLLPGSAKVAGAFSPVFRMLNSSFVTASEFANRIFDHSIITKGVAKGEARKENFERLFWGIASDSKRIGWQLEGLRSEANGIEINRTRDTAEKQLSERINKGPAFDREAFGASVAEVIRSGIQHENKSVNEAASLLNQHLLKTYTRFLRAYGLSEEVFPPRTAVGYLMRNYNTDALVSKPSEWIETIASELKRQDELIEELQSPLRDAEEKLERLKQFKLGETQEDRALVNEIEEARRNVRAEKEKLQARLNDDENLHILLEERNFLSSQQRKELSALLKPIKDFEAKVEKQRSLVAAGKAELSRLKSLAVKAKKSGTKEKNVERLQRVEDQLATEENKLRNLENDFLDAQAELNGRANEGDINERFFIKDPETGFINFRDPDRLPKFRKVYEDDDWRRDAASQYRDVILNRTPEQLGRQLLGSISGGNLENPLSSRSLMIPDMVLQNAGFLSNDIQKNVAIYDAILGKKSAFKEVFSAFGTEDGIQGITKELNKELTRKEREIMRLPESEREKARLKLNKDFSKALKDIKGAYDTAMGIDSRRSRTARAWSKGLRDFTVSTRLGAVPLTMVTDFAAIFLNHSFMDVFRDGLLPFAKTFNGLIKTSEGEAYRESAGHLYIATEHLGSAMSDKFWNSSTQTDVALGGKIGSALEGLAHLSGNLFGTNYLDNMMQRLAAVITQSKIMRAMFNYEKGTISKKEILHLNKLGIDPKEWSQRFIDNFKTHGGEDNGFGGFYSKYYDWSDVQASVKMGNAIRSGVRASVLKKGLGDAPFWTSDPVWGMVTHLKGWLFSAFSRYTIPLMQRPDAEKALGMGFMLMMGGLVDPLRMWSRGEEYDFENKEKWALDSINNSGIFGIMTDIIQDLNVMTGGEFFSHMKNDRYRDRTIMGIIGGPIGGVVDDMISGLTSVASGKMNQRDFNKLLRLVPLSQAWYFRYFSNKITESLDLPKTRAHAQGWFEQG